MTPLRTEAYLFNQCIKVAENTVHMQKQILQVESILYILQTAKVTYAYCSSLSNQFSNKDLPYHTSDARSTKSIKSELYNFQVKKNEL